MVDSIMKFNLYLSFTIFLFTISESTDNFQNAVTTGKTLPKELDILGMENALRQIFTDAVLKTLHLSTPINSQSLNNIKVPLIAENRCLTISEEIDETNLENSYTDKKHISRLETRHQESGVICSTVRQGVGELCKLFKRILSCMRDTLRKNMQDEKQHPIMDGLKNVSLKLEEISQGKLEKITLTELAKTLKQLAQGAEKISSEKRVTRIDPNADGPLILSIVMVVEGIVIFLVFVIMLYVVIGSAFSGEAYLDGYSLYDFEDDGELSLPLFEYTRFDSPDLIDLERSKSPAPVHLPKRY